MISIVTLVEICHFNMELWPWSTKSDGIIQ